MKRLNIFILLSLIISSFLLFGCGGGDSGTNLNMHISTQGNVTLCGYVNEGSINHSKTASELRYSLGGNLSGITVFLENNRTIKGITDESGKFVIENVPEGYQSLIAEKQEADKIIYRQRLYNIYIKGILNYFELQEPISILPSPYSLTLTITDTNNQAINNAKVSFWGRDYNSDDKGMVTLSDFPELSDEEAIISANGYKSTKMKLSFGETLNSMIFVKLTKTTTQTTNNKVDISGTWYSNYERNVPVYANNSGMVDHLIIKADGTYTNNLYGNRYFESPEPHYITSDYEVDVWEGTWYEKDGVYYFNEGTFSDDPCIYKIDEDTLFLSLKSQQRDPSWPVHITTYKRTHNGKYKSNRN